MILNDDNEKTMIMILEREKEEGMDYVEREASRSVPYRMYLYRKKEQKRKQQNIIHVFICLDKDVCVSKLNLGIKRNGSKYSTSTVQYLY
mmetsp:Transcript_49019/g.52924  ORF Transcript_49019/g.52924 Transcript_49019/m.52924 type:complete len:90 (-) Transcript_49019:20-289(-)